MTETEYFLPYKALLNRLDMDEPFEPGKTYEVGGEFILGLLKIAAASQPLDEDYYLRLHPDVAAKVRSGEVPSAKWHYTNVGYFENRKPRYWNVDEDFYREIYPDMAQTNLDCEEHYNKYGFFEGRVGSSKEFGTLISLLDMFSSKKIQAAE